MTPSAPAVLPWEGSAASLSVHVPHPDLFRTGGSSAGGAFSLAGPVPPSLPAGLVFYMQFWTVDAAAPVGFAASNALSGTIPQ